MATVAVQAQDRTISIGRILTRGFGIIAAHPFATFAIVLVFGVLPAMIMDIAILDLLPWNGPTAWKIEYLLINMWLGLLWSTVIEGTLAPSAVAHAEGRRGDIVDTLPSALVRLVPLLLLGFVIGVTVSFGFVLLIVPGMVLLMAWWVAAPAMVVEHLGVIEALKRSVALTRGARWHAFGINLILGIGAYLIGLAAHAAGISTASPPSIGALWEMNGTVLLFLGINILIRTVSSSIAAVMHASFYIELREWKEGPPADSLAEVFR